jgi:hypothetical protein
MTIELSSDCTLHEVNHGLLLAGWRASSQLRRLAQFVAILSVSNPDTLHKIGRLRDHKGALYGVGLEPFDDDDLKTVKLAWALLGRSG